MESGDGKPEPPAAAPVQSLTLRLEPMQRARFDALVEKLMKRHHQSREQILLMALETMLVGKEDSSREDSSIDNLSTRVDAGTPYQVVIYQCETCKTRAVGPERSALSAAESAQVACGSTNFLEVHHLRTRSAGGGNGEENLITLCASCHRHLHEHGNSARWFGDARER